jgi:hypothetical protein
MNKKLDYDILWRTLCLILQVNDKPLEKVHDVISYSSKHHDELQRLVVYKLQVQVQKLLSMKKTKSVSQAKTLTVQWNWIVSDS